MASAKPIATTTHSGLGDEPLYAFGRERRMHARAYDYWVSLLRGRRMPLLSEVDPQQLAQFADRSVMVDLPEKGGVPRFAHVGKALRDEADISAEQPATAEIRDGTLLFELLRRFDDIAAHQAPVGLEAELEGRGGRLLHRGILLPFADDRGRLASIYGVVSWKQVAAVETAPDIAAAVAGALASRSAAPLICAWGDGPGAATTAAATRAPQPLDQRLATARTWAAVAATDRTQSNASLHAALGGAHDYRLATRDRVLTAASVVRLVFGGQLSRLNRIRYRLTLDHATRLGVGPGRVPTWLDNYAGGFAAIARAERRARFLGRREVAGDAGQRHTSAIEQPGRMELSVDQDLFSLIGRPLPHGSESPTPVSYDLLDNGPQFAGARAR